jgi:hypothetical protein
VLNERAAQAIPDLVKGRIAAAGHGVKKDLGSLSDVTQDPDYASRAAFLYLLHNDINRVLDLIATPDRPLVIFVDDLDRCSPRVVAQTIEDINLFLAGQFPNCVFVLAVESAVVAAHIEAQHKDLLSRLKLSDLGGDWMALGWRFLEKIVQLPFTLPRPGEGEAERYLNTLLDVEPDTDGVASPSPIGAGQISTELEDFAAENLNEVSNERSRLAQRLVDADELSQEQADSIATEVAVRAVADLWSDNDPTVRDVITRHAMALPVRNPREMKRIISLFQFYNLVAAPQWVQAPTTAAREEVFEQVVRLAALAIRWPFFLNLLARTCPEDNAGAASSGSERSSTVLAGLESVADDEDEWNRVLADLDLALPADSDGSDNPARFVPIEAWEQQLDDLRDYLGDPAAPRIGTFAKRFL